MPKFTIELTDENINYIKSELLNEPCRCNNCQKPDESMSCSKKWHILRSDNCCGCGLMQYAKRQEHDCIFKDDFELYDFIIEKIRLSGYYNSKNTSWNKILALYRIKKYIHDNDMEFVPDWNNGDQNKYYINFSYSNKSYFVNDYRLILIIGIPFLFSSKEHAQKVIDNCRADLDILMS